MYLSSTLTNHWYRCTLASTFSQHACKHTTTVTTNKVSPNKWCGNAHFPCQQGTTNARNHQWFSCVCVSLSPSLSPTRHCVALRCIALRCTALHCTALHCVALDWIGFDWIGFEWIGFEWIGLDSIRLDWIRMDWIALDSNGLDWIRMD